MKRSILKPALQTFALLLAVLFATRVGTATTAVMLTDEDLIASSRVILIGDVQSVKAQWDAGQQTINTYVKVNVTRLLKGQLQNQTIVFKQLGGRLGDEATVIFGAPEYSAGQQLLLFLDTREDGTLRVAHLFQGKYDVIEESGSLRVKRKVSRDEVNLLGATEAPNITNDAPLARFAKKVKRVLRDSAATVSAYEAQHATPIVEVPAEYVDDGGQGAGDVSAQYTFLGSYRWFEPDSGQPVTFRVNSAGAPTASGGVTEINQAFAAWTAVQTTSLTLQNIGSTTAYGFQRDGVSALSFNDPLDQMSDPVNCAGTLAIGGVTSAGGSTVTIGGQSFSHIYEGDVVFNRNFSCFLGISANLAEVATHEIGHAIGFGHSSDANAIMYATAHGNGRGATLGSDDIAAVTFLYPGAKSVQPRFSDVPLTNPYYTYIDKIAQRGITSGCTPTTFCPDGLVTRDQMAVFIERALGVTSPPTPTSQRFTDVPPSHWAYAFIGDFSTRGITAGCTASTYCPGDLVTREQMAVFMERALGRANPPWPASQRYVDVPPSQWSYAFVESFSANNASRGILNVIKQNCNTDGVHFCPSQPLTRGEMAAWLVIAFNL